MNMKTNFFQQIAALNVPGNWKLTLHTADNINFTVSALFTALHCGDNAAKTIPPMLIKGTADELAEGFFEAISQPVAVTAGLYHNMEQYLKSVEQARLNSKEEQDKKKATAVNNTLKGKDNIETPEMAQAKAEKQQAYDDALKQIEQLRAQMKYAEALELLPNPLDYPAKRIELDKKKQELENLVKLKEKSLFA
jgi:PRTRC genetic system protein E